MNKKYIALMLAFIALSAYASVFTVTAAQNTTVTLIPSNSQITLAQVGQTLKVNITIENVANLWQWAATASWDPTALNLTGVTEGPFLQQDDESTLFVFASSDSHLNNGLLQDLSCTRMVNSAINGSGTLATLTFKIMSFKGTQIAFNSTLIQPATNLDPNQTIHPHPLIQHTDVGTTITISQESPSPTTSASVQPSSSPTIAQNPTSSPDATFSDSPSLSLTPSSAPVTSSPPESASTSNLPSVSASNSPQASLGETNTAGLPMDVLSIVVAGVIIAVVIALAVVVRKRKT